ERPLCPDLACNRILASLPRHLAAHPIDETSNCDVVEPSAGIPRQSFDRPLRRGRHQRLLNRILGGVEIPMATGHDAEHLRRHFAQQALDVHGGLRVHQSTGGALITWRTSIGMLSGMPPLPGAAEAVAARR